MLATRSLRRARWFFYVPTTQSVSCCFWLGCSWLGCSFVPGCFPWWCGHPQMWCFFGAATLSIWYCYYIADTKDDKSDILPFATPAKASLAWDWGWADSGFWFSGSCSGGFAALGASGDVGTSAESVEDRRRNASDALRMKSDMVNMNACDNVCDMARRYFFLSVQRQMTIRIYVPSRPLYSWVIARRMMSYGPISIKISWSLCHYIKDPDPSHNGY